VVVKLKESGSNRLEGREMERGSEKVVKEKGKKRSFSGV
jgi:hypothetical protein